ncbi:MCE family protein [Actinomadura barringtoniae]|uniref:MCE family protein n=1 Tax=Actinomadura barringtoniae TaxID=1427535 RepID=A0A939T372_9ACTN|nr:MCE family protein [Actinomadura barringtoniae]MBO2447683.1 MCE family protein [Actinomadura barringtoniae]
MMSPRRSRLRLLAAGVTGLLVLALGGCSVVPGPLSASPRYRITAYFARAVSFYPGSRVQVMGVNVGKVDSVTPLNGEVRVVASIDEKVRIPANATAAIVPLSLIGERTLTFSPAWRPGMAKLAPDSVLHQDRTRIPVEVNDALKSFGKILDGLDPAKADTVLGNAASSVNGNGVAFNQAFEQAGLLVNNLAGQDRQLLKVAQDLNRLAGVVRGREKTLGSLVDSFGQASQVLASERKNIQTLVTSIADLVRRGDVLIKIHQETLPDDLARMAQVSLIVKGRAESVGGLLKSLPGLGYQFVNAYDPKTHAINLRVTLDNFARAYLTALLREPRASDKVPCPLPPPYSNCH